jgi:hypothetical protein
MNIHFLQTFFTLTILSTSNSETRAHPETIDKKNKSLVPLSNRDINMHVMYVVFTRFIAGGDLGCVKRWPGMGSWVTVIEFGEKIHAKVLLSCGNSTQNNSPHNGDQLELFTSKK